MMLLTKALRRKLPPLYATDGQEKKMCYVRFFCPWNTWEWYVVEFDGNDTFFGFVKGDYPEWGYFSLSELSSVHKFGLFIERDLYYEPKMIDINSMVQEAS